LSRAIARDEPGVREHETEQRAAARDEPGVREQEQSQLERISPNIKYGNYLSRKRIEDVLREFKNAEKNNKNLWKNITGGNTMRKWIPDMYDNNAKCVALKVIVEKALKAYITIVQERYPTLKYFKVGALKSLPGAKSQYVGHGRKLHSEEMSWE